LLLGEMPAIVRSLRESGHDSSVAGCESAADGHRASVKLALCRLFGARGGGLALLCRVGAESLVRRAGACRIADLGHALNMEHRGTIAKSFGSGVQLAAMLPASIRTGGPRWPCSRC